MLPDETQDPFAENLPRRFDAQRPVRQSARDEDVDPMAVATHPFATGDLLPRRAWGDLEGVVKGKGDLDLSAQRRSEFHVRHREAHTQGLPSMEE